jgi:hypothetical protein
MHEFQQAVTQNTPRTIFDEHDLLHSPSLQPEWKALWPRVRCVVATIEYVAHLTYLQQLTAPKQAKSALRLHAWLCTSGSFSTFLLL